jgi:hypothetical protein
MKNAHKNIFTIIKHFKGVLIIFLGILVTSFTTEAQFCFSSAKLHTVFELLPGEYKKEIEAKGSSVVGTFFLDVNLLGIQRKLVYRFNNFHELDHLGLYLIDNKHDVASLREVFDYLERAFLVSALLNESHPLAQEIADKKIAVLYNGCSLKEQNCLTMMPKVSINKDTPLKISYDRNFFLIIWLLDSTNKFEVKIPNVYSLITEKTKDELEKELSQKLKSSIEGNFVLKIPSKSHLIPYFDNIYLFQGESYSNKPELSSNKFFIINDSIYPVFNSTSYKESIQNLFLNVLPSQLKLNLTQKLYGGSDEKIRINLNSFFNNFSSDFIIYFGWQSENKLSLKLSVFISNSVFNYIHLLVVTTNSNTIFKKNGEVEGVFFSYIPKVRLNNSYY